MLTLAMHTAVYGVLQVSLTWRLAGFHWNPLGPSLFSSSCNFVVDGIQLLQLALDKQHIGNCTQAT